MSDQPFFGEKWVPSPMTPPNDKMGQDDSEVPSSSTFEGEDFLFHLYRGSELLQSNQVALAREELERALRLKPRDLEGQGLLGVVYFRLGHYPRAIEIYRDMIEACPRETGPRVNLSLCFLKTGQPHRARETLEEVIRLAPGHQRAWGYLGLAYQQLGDLIKARECFENAGQSRMARRMERLLSQAKNLPLADRAVEREMLKAAAGDLVQRFDADNSPEVSLFHTAPGDLGEPQLLAWSTIEPGLPQVAERSADRPPLASVPAPRLDGWFTTLKSGSLAQAHNEPTREAPPPLGALEGSSVLGIEINEPFAVLPASVVVAARHGGHFTHEPLTHEARPNRDCAFVIFRGPGRLILKKREREEHTVMLLSGHPLYTRERLVVGFDKSVHHDHAQLSNVAGLEPLLLFTGRGRVILRADSELLAVRVAPDTPLSVRSHQLVGWLGRIIVTSLESQDSPDGSSLFCGLNGDGLALLDLHRS